MEHKVIHIHQGNVKKNIQLLFLIVPIFVFVLVLAFLTKGGRLKTAPNSYSTDTLGVSVSWEE